MLIHDPVNYLILTIVHQTKFQEWPQDSPTIMAVVGLFVHVSAIPLNLKIAQNYFVMVSKMEFDPPNVDMSNIPTEPTISLAVGSRQRTQFVTIPNLIGNRQRARSTETISDLMK